MKSLKYYFLNPRQFLMSLVRDYGSWLPDKQYLRIQYLIQMGSCLHLAPPRTFNEKLQWLKLYDHRPEYTFMVDKYAVKAYVANIIGENYIVPTYGVWEKPEDVNFDDLPQQFVLKTTHGGGSGGVIICRDKSHLNKEAIIWRLSHAFKSDIYRDYREWPYKNVPRRIIAEKYLSDPQHEELVDYKIYCFGGEPKYCQVISDRKTRESMDFFDTAWNHLPIHKTKNYPFAEKKPSRPVNFSKMLELSGRLSACIPFLRVDFYEIDGQIYFGELTFYPASGMGGFSPKEWDYKLGELIHLPVKGVNVI